MPIIHYSAWYPVLFLVLALAISLTVAIRRGLRTFRGFRAFSGSAEQALGAVTKSAEQAEARAAAISGATERLERARARLDKSLAELAVLRAAAAEVQRTFGAVRGLVPRKGRA
jgi:hypothetical protein